MPRKIFKKLFPVNPSHRYHRWFSAWAHASIWHFNRRTVARAFAVGLFSAFIPIPGQMVLAAGLAIIFRANLPVSAALVWVTNPLTFPALFFTAYKFGAWIMQTHLETFDFELTLNWLFTELQDRWQPFLVGCFATGALVGALGYISVMIYWRLYVLNVRRRRRRL